jgi:hypothetical protein
MKITTHVVLDAKEVLDAIINHAKETIGGAPGSAAVKLTVVDGEVTEAVVDFQDLPRRKL